MKPEKLLDIDWDFGTAKTNQSTHRLHPYPAKYIPQIPRALINELSLKGETVADIFSGSGTTLVEANLLGRNAVGIDANPLSSLIAKAKTSPVSKTDILILEEMVRRAQELSAEIVVKRISGNSLPFISNAYRPNDDAIEFWFIPFVVEELAEVLSWCNEIEAEKAKNVALTVFSSIIVTVSKQDSDTRYVRRDKNIKPGDVCSKFAMKLDKAVKAVSNFSNEVHHDVKSTVLFTDILTAPKIKQFDLMVCSPPYPNAFSYHLYHKNRMIWLEMNHKEFKKQEIGSHRKYSKANSTINTFRDEMESIFEWLYQHLASNRYACFVIGNSTIRGEVFDNAEILSQVAINQGFRETLRISRELLATKKSFNPKMGSIRKEKILILQKQG